MRTTIPRARRGDDPLSAQFSPAEAAVRLTTIRSQLQFGSVAAEVPETDRDRLVRWYDIFTRKGLEMPQEYSFAASMTIDLDELSWHIHGPSGPMTVPMPAAFEFVGGSPESEARLGRIGQAILPVDVGMSLHVGGAGADAEWYIPGPFEAGDLDRLDDCDLPGPLLDLAATKRDEVLEIADSIATSRRSTIAWLAGDLSGEAVTFDDALAAVRSIYGSSEIDEPDVDTLVALCELHRGPIGASRAFSDTGTVKFGLVLVEPPLELLLALTGRSRFDGPVDDRLSEFLASLGLESPTAIEVESWADRQRIRVHATIPHLD